MNAQGIQLELSSDARRVPHLDQWFGLWAMEESAMQGQLEFLRGLNVRLHLEEIEGRGAGSEGSATPQAAKMYGTEVEDGLAIFRVQGTLMKHQSSLSTATSTVMLARAIRQAAREESITRAMLLIDSPGGTVAGTAALADAVNEFGRSKPIWSYAEDLAASAAYWVGSQGQRLLTNRTGALGYIGTYGVAYDYSAQATMLGIKVHVIRAGAFKGAGTPGTEVTAEQLAEAQRVVNQLNDQFVAGVAQGRRLSAQRAAELADGRGHVGTEAVKLGLADAVMEFEEALAELRALGKAKGARGEGRPTSNQGRRSMDDKTNDLVEGTTLTALRTATPAATLAELKQACPGASADFLLAQLEKGATAEQAMRAQLETVAAEKAALEKELAEAKAAAGKQEKPAGKGAFAPVGTSRGKAGEGPEANAGEERAEFAELVAAEIARGKSRFAAMKIVARRHPQAHGAYVAGTNASRPAVQERIAERFSL